MRDKFSILDEEPKKEYEEILVNKILIGSIIKTEYDEDRIKIQEKHNPKRILNNGNFLFGCLFDPNEKHINVINQIKKYKEIDLYTYNKILQENNLSCDENFSYFKNMLYPVDTVSIRDYIQNFNYDDFFEKQDQIPIYETITSVNMFILFP